MRRRSPQNGDNKQGEPEHRIDNDEDLVDFGASPFFEAVDVASHHLIC